RRAGARRELGNPRNAGRDGPPRAPALAPERPRAPRRPAHLRARHRNRRQSGQPFLRAAAPKRSVASVDGAVPAADRGRTRLTRGRPRRPLVPSLAWGFADTRRRGGRLHAALHRRGAPWPLRQKPLARARRTPRALRTASAVQRGGAASHRFGLTFSRTGL